MKLGTLKQAGNRDGELVVVSRDNQTAAKAGHIARCLRDAVENWAEAAPQLEALYTELNEGRASDTFAVDQQQFHSPLPRTWGWIDGSAFIQHIKLVRQARNAPLPEGLHTDPLVYQGGSDTFLAPRQDVPLIDFSHGMDFEGEVAVVVDDVPMGTKEADAAQYIRLVMLCNDVSLRGLIPPELKKGFGFYNSKPSSAFSPFALTLDELGDNWRDGRLHLPLHVTYNGAFFGNADAGHMHFSFPRLIEHAAMTRALSAGTIIGSGTVANEDTSRGSSCLAEKRMLEKINTGEFVTPFMKEGDTIKIEMMDQAGNNLFGTIDQKIVAFEG